MNIDLLASFVSGPALPVALLLGLISPMVGMFLVVRRFSLLADTLAHVSLFGVALGMLLGIPAVLAPMLVAILGGLGIELLRQSRRILSEATLAVFLSGSLAVALILFAILGVNADVIEAYLFGDLASVVLADLILIAVIAGAVSGFMIFAYRKLFLMALDEDLARVAGVRVNLLNAGFMLLASSVVAIAIKVVGVLLVSALIVLPVLAAMQWRFSFRNTLFFAVVFSEAAVLIGYSLSFWWQLPSGATIALFALMTFIFSYLACLKLNPSHR